MTCNGGYTTEWRQTNINVRSTDAGQQPLRRCNFWFHFSRQPRPVVQLRTNAQLVHRPRSSPRPSASHSLRRKLSLSCMIVYTVQRWTGVPRSLYDILMTVISELYSSLAVLLSARDVCNNYLFGHLHGKLLMRDALGQSALFLHRIRIQMIMYPRQDALLTRMSIRIHIYELLHTTTTFV